MNEAIKEFNRKYIAPIERGNVIRVWMATEAFRQAYKKAFREDEPGSTAKPTPRKRLLEATRVSEAVAAFRRAYSRD